MKIPFSPPFVDRDVINEVVDSLNSGWITTGPKVKLLEEEITIFTNAKRTVCVNSWTSGAILVLKWLGIQSGDEVIIPAYTYSATALAVLHCGATPVMIDITDDFTIDVTKIENAITEKTKVIMPVDIAGWPCDYDSIYQVVNKQSVRNLYKPSSEKQKLIGRILVVSDAAHSIGAMYKNRKVGEIADITIFSFHAVKNITTAEGGAISLNLPKPFSNDDEYKLMKLYSLNGQNKDALTKTLLGGWKYDILFQGLKVNMPDMCAAVGLAQLRKYDSFLLSERKKIAKFYFTFFEKFSFIQTPVTINNERESCYHIYPLRIIGITEVERNEIIDKIFQQGVSVNVHFIPMPMLTLFKELGYKIENYPISYDNYSREISLPLYPQLTIEELEFICNSVINGYKSVINK
jgi:dTDP-4-amino-4,6-dideoxygalactose transaminase